MKKLKQKKQELEKYNMGVNIMDNKLEKIIQLINDEYYSTVEFDEVTDEYGFSYCINDFYSAPRDLLNHNNAKIFFEKSIGKKLDCVFNIYNYNDNEEISEIMFRCKNKDSNLVVFLFGSAGSYSDENFDAFLNIKIYDDLSDELIDKYKNNILNKNLEKHISNFSENLRSLSEYMTKDQILNIMRNNEDMNELLNLNFNNNLKEELSEEIKSKPANKNKKKI